MTSESIVTHWIALYVHGYNRRKYFDEIYLDSFWVEHIAKEIQNVIRNKNIKPNIYRIQAYVLIMCRKFFIGFVDFVLKGKSLLEYTNLLFPNHYENNDKTLPKYY